MTDLAVPRKTVNRWVPLLTAKVSEKKPQLVLGFDVRSSWVRGWWRSIARGTVLCCLGDLQVDLLVDLKKASERTGWGKVGRI